MPVICVDFKGNAVRLISVHFTSTVRDGVGCQYYYIYRRRSDWNSGGTHGGTYYKSPAVEAKKNIFLHCDASNLVLKILQHDKIWGGAIFPLQIVGDLSPRSPP